MEVTLGYSVQALIALAKLCVSDYLKPYNPLLRRACGNFTYALARGPRTEHSEAPSTQLMTQADNIRALPKDTHTRIYIYTYIYIYIYIYILALHLTAAWLSSALKSPLLSVIFASAAALNKTYPFDYYPLNTH